jgi:SNF2 family DNA or RNA helicase
VSCSYSITTFLVEAGNAESFLGNESVDDALRELGLNTLFDKLPGIEIALMPHQVMGVAWMLRKEAGKLQGGCLADEMGLGKVGHFGIR